jgi:quinol monooxygenase YgiN
MEEVELSMGDAWNAYVETGEKRSGLLGTLGMNEHKELTTVMCPECGLVRHYAEFEERGRSGGAPAAPATSPLVAEEILSCGRADPRYHGVKPLAVLRSAGMSDSEYALQARLEAKPEKADEAAEFLESALPAAEAEEGTTTWFALRLDETTFGIFDTFPDEAGRKAHLDGEIAAELFERADELFVEEPQVDEIDVLAAKHS